MKVDIVGGGLAGLSTAITIKKFDNDIDVIIHEKFKKIGYNLEGRRCGEAHSLAGKWAKWKPHEKSIFNHITTGEAQIGEKKYIYHPPKGFGFILNRQEFICQLAGQAEKLGVNIQTQDKIKSIDDMNGDYIVDASGCPSTIKRKLNLKRGIKGISYQQTLQDSNVFISDTIKLFFSGDFGYYWIFPRDPDKKEVNVGVGFFGDLDLNLKQLVEDFKKKHNIKGVKNHISGGKIPFGLQKPLKHRNILFVGDAGVGTFPLTGQGIYRALLSGEIAGKCIAMRKTNKYPFIIKQEFMKWDFLCKNFGRLCVLLRRINTDLVLSSLNTMARFTKITFH